jgi:choice-of-anchor B domain-containing protein
MKKSFSLRFKYSCASVFFALFFSNLFAQNISYRSNLQYPRILSNLWGYTDTVNHKEYALVGVETGLSIVDVTDPDNPSALFYVPNDTSTWQEPKVWSHYAYVTNETGSGLLIVDLGNLPDTVTYLHWSNIPNQNFQKAHSCFIDEKGFIYINGTNVFNHTFICDLKPDPMNPTYVGFYDDFYVHDCFARNDTLYTAEILNGQFSVIDVRNKDSLQVIVRQTTPYFFSHNVWLSDDSKYLFNTDEKKFAPVTSYDISDLNNIKELDYYRHSDYDSSIAHNTYYREGYLYTSYYRDGITIVDAHRPENLIEVGWFDTSPFPPGEGYQGCWGVYPFFASGNIICSDRQEGLFVLSPSLQRACYLEGNVTNLQTGNALPGVSVEIIGHPRIKTTDVLGNYKTGLVDSGEYDVRFTNLDANCLTRIVSSVNLSPGNVTVLNVAFSCALISEIIEIKDDFTFTAQPNVFNHSTQLIFHSSQESTSVISLFDASGRMLKRFEIETPNAEIMLGEELPAGIYFAKAEQGTASKTIRIFKSE